MKSYPVEFRRRVVALAAEGKPTAAIAAALGVSGAWVRSIQRLHASGQPLEPKSRANQRKSLAVREGERIKARVAEHPGTTLEDLKRDLKLSASVSNIWYAVRDLGLSLKKKASGRPSRTGPTSSPTGPRGGSPRSGSTRGGSSSSTRRSAPPR